MGIKLDTDINALVTILKQTGERVQRGVAQKMVDGGRAMRDRAREYAPVDLGNLEHAIKMQSDRTGIHGRTQVYIFVDEGMEVRGRPGHLVGEYAMIMHESDYNLGLKSQAKAAALGVHVGPKYLERAANDMIDGTVSSMLREARRLLSIERGASFDSYDGEMDYEEDY